MKRDTRQLLKDVYGLIPYAWRVPKIYFNTQDLINQNLDKKSILDWQLTKLKEIIEYSYKNVPGYYQLYKEAGITPEDIQVLDDIKNLPFVSKEIIRDNIKDFISRAVPKSEMIETRTSGSSGTPFLFYRTRKEEWIEQAFVSKAWSKGGWDITQSGIMLRGGYAGDKKNIIKRSGNFNFYVHNRSYLMSPNFLTDEYYPIYRDFFLTHRDLKYIFALPSSATFISQLIIKHHDEGIANVSAIYLSSESIYGWQYEYIRKAFPNANIISLYGQSERVIMAYWCNESQKYHIDPFYGYTEILRNGIDARMGEKGELIGTSFWNKATPFIRYKTSDYALRGSNQCDHCGLEYDMIESIDGRLQDVLVGKEGRLISIGTFDGSLENSDLFKDIEKFKIIQYEKGSLEMEIKVSDSFNEDKKDAFWQSISEYLGVDFTLTLSVVEDIKPNANGKFKSVEQHLLIDFDGRENS